MSQTICITGATSGFGRAIAYKFAKAGWKCIVTGRRTERLKELAAELSPAEILTLPFDVRDEAQVKKALGNLPEKFAKVDVLVNNAGLALGTEPAQKANMQDWEDMVNTNIKGLIYCTHTLLPGMVDRKKGHVINIGSITGHYPYMGSNVYGGSKAFVWQFSKGLRCDVHGSGVRVTNIEPGMAESEFSLVRFKGDAKKSEQFYAGKKALTPEDIAESVFWAVNMPAHVNINNIEMMPTDQSWASLNMHKD